MAKKIGFKSYCWAIGTTSYRTDNFNLSIEKQLQLLKEFRELEENKNKKWIKNKKFQAEYYNFLKENNFVKGEAAFPDKDAREKTSGLRDIGLLDDEHNITDVGLELLKIATSDDFATDNFLEIPKDSFLYFKQLLKTANNVEGKIVRPFVVFLYAVNELGYLTNDEFTYLLPLCVDEHTTKNIVKSIKNYRETGEKNFDDIILSVLMEKDNYKQALNLLKTEPISEELICNIGINRKSAKYDKPYYTLYSLLKKIVISKDNLALEFYEATKKLTNSKEDVQQIKYKDHISYWVAFEDGNLLEDYTGMKLPEDKDFVFRDMMVGFSDKYNIVRCSMTVRQISTGQSALINSQFFANEVKDGDELGDGRDNVKASFVYTLSNGSKAYFIWEGKDEPMEGVRNTHDPDEYQTVYFCAHGIQYQMSIGRTEKQTKLAVDIMELFVK